jgi:hypothetical protein
MRHALNRVLWLHCTIERDAIYTQMLNQVWLKCSWAIFNTLSCLKGLKESIISAWPMRNQFLPLPQTFETHQHNSNKKILKSSCIQLIIKYPPLHSHSSFTQACNHLPNRQSTHRIIHPSFHQKIGRPENRTTKPRFNPFNQIISKTPPLYTRIVWKLPLFVYNAISGLYMNRCLEDDQAQAETHRK